MDDRSRRTVWFQALETHEGPLMRYAMHLLGDLEQAREVVQETFLKLWQADMERVESHLAEWLFTVCRNRAVDVLRKRKPMETLNHAQAQAQASPAPGPAETLEHRQTASQVLAAIEALPENQREVIRLKFQNGMSYKEISRITGHSVSHVGVLIHKAMRTLRAELRDTIDTKTRRAS